MNEYELGVHFGMRGNNHGLPGHLIFMLAGCLGLDVCLQHVIART